MRRAALRGTTACWAAWCLLVAAGGPRAAGQSAPAAPASRPATTTSAPAGEEDSALPRALLEAARQSFVIVELWYRKDTSESLVPGDRDYEVNRIYEEYVDQKRPEERPGVVLDDRGRVLIVDDGLEDRFLDRIVVRDGQGQAMGAERARLLFDAPGVLLKVDANFAGRLAPLACVPLKEADADRTFYQARHFRTDDAWRVGAASLSPTVRYGPGGERNLFFGYRSEGASRRGSPDAPKIIANQDGEPLGVALASFLDLRQEEILWRGADLAAGEGIDWADLRKAEEAARAGLIQATQEVVIRLRGGDSEDYRSSASGREVSVYGLAISETDVFVPRPLSSQSAGQIDKIFIKFSAISRGEAAFVGAFKDFGGFVVRLAKGKLPAAARLVEQDPPRMKPLWEARTRKRFGEKYVDLIANRLIGKARGYRGEYHGYAAREVAPGSALVDFQGRVVGFHLAERLEHEEERRLEAGSGRYGRQEPRVRLYLAGELRSALGDVAAHLDPKIVVKSRSQAKRRAWLGVEYVPMTADLAEQFKAEKPTRDGQLGFVVNAVYAGSPAATLGLRVGDILLQLKAPDMPYPIELASRLAQEGGYRSRFLRGDDDDGAGPPAQSWKSRSNFLTRAFDAIGVGKPVEITYYRPDEKTGQGQQVGLTYTIQQAPVDTDSAPRWQNRKLGLTAKDITYEIRHALSLKDADPGVIVAKVEDGSPMTVARIYPNEIIVRLDDQPLQSARQMRELIDKAAQAGRGKVRLTVLRLGKTRFADLAVTEYDPADDEGLNEDE